MMDDWQLLEQYASRNSEEAFRALVDRHASMVYHAALRQLGSPHAAEEVAQAVFIALAQKAAKISRQTLLSGWLFRATRYAVLTRLRDEACRRRHEKEVMESTTLGGEAESIWQQIAPLLDEAMDRLSSSDRELVVSRFFGNKSHREIAQTLGITEDTAKKRLSRALGKLRMIFARRGVVVPAAALAVAFSAFGAQAAPAGLASSISAAALAHGTVASATSSTLAHATWKFLAWAKGQTAMVIGVGVLLGAAGAATLVEKTAASPADSGIGRLERQTGKHIAWDKHLTMPGDLNFANLPIEQALDKIAVQACAYWTIDYVVYDSDQSLQDLLGLLHEGAALESGGWTNLSSMPLEPRVSVLSYDPHGRSKIFLRLPKDHPPDRVGMIVVLGPNADPKLAPDSGKGDPGMARMSGRPPQGPVVEMIRDAMKNGVEDGALAPERLLAPRRLIPAMHPDTPVPATAECAARLAKAAHARWTTVYTLRKSPIDGAGIKLVHSGMESMYGPAGLPASPEEMAGGLASSRFNLSPEDRAAHERAVEAWKKAKQR